MLPLRCEQPLGGEHGAQALELGEEVSDPDGANLFGAKLQAALAGVVLRLREHDYPLPGCYRWLHRPEYFRVGHDGDRHLDVGVAQCQIELPGARARAVLGDLAIDPDRA